MKKAILTAVLCAALVGWAVAAPTVDGKVGAGEYPNAQSLIDGKLTLNWAPDGAGGLFVAVSAKGSGWAGVGFGSQRMNGAYIYLGYVDAGKAVFSEQAGKGHSHRDSGKKTADQSAVSSKAGVTVVEFHVPAAALPFTGKSVPFIVAFSDSPDLTTFHGDNFGTGSLTLP
ncbi:MAG TPA: DOMON domain-containing protein [Spirochaetia bacterium]|jgi:hypothetical protein|nr:DOMON domain-containing protein [Spirochaetia bacterium]